VKIRLDAFRNYIAEIITKTFKIMLPKTVIKALKKMYVENHDKSL